MRRIPSNRGSRTRWLLKVAAIVAVGLSVPPGYTQVVNQAPNPVIIQPIVEQIELGPSLDVIPYVSADGYTIQMTIVPTYREFLGYDQPPLLPGVPANAVQAPMVLPKFRLRQVVTSSIVWDGQTVVLGGLMAEDTQKTKDKVPIIGDLPLLGRLFRSESSQIRKKNLLIFVTPTIIDPAGNRAHTDEEMPFAQNAVPPQKPLAPTPEVPQPKP